MSSRARSNSSKSSTSLTTGRSKTAKAEPTSKAKTKDGVSSSDENLSILDSPWFTCEILFSLILIGLLAALPFNLYRPSASKTSSTSSTLSTSLDATNFPLQKNPFLPYPVYGPFGIEELDVLRTRSAANSEDGNEHYVLSIALRYWVLQNKLNAQTNLGYVSSTPYSDSHASVHLLLSEALHAVSLSTYYYNFGVFGQPPTLHPSSPPIDKMNQVARLDTYIMFSKLCSDFGRYDDAIWLNAKGLNAGKLSVPQKGLTEEKKERIRYRMAALHLSQAHLMLTTCRQSSRLNGRGDLLSTCTHPHDNFPQYANDDLTQFRTVIGLSCHKAMVLAENSILGCVHYGRGGCLGPIIGYPSFVEKDEGLWEKLVDRDVKRNEFYLMESWYDAAYEADGTAGFDKKAFKYHHNEMYLAQPDKGETKVDGNFLARVPAEGNESDGGEDSDKDKEDGNGFKEWDVLASGDITSLESENYGDGGNESSSLELYDEGEEDDVVSLNSEQCFILDHLGYRNMRNRILLDGYKSNGNSAVEQMASKYLKEGVEVGCEKADFKLVKFMRALVTVAKRRGGEDLEFSSQGTPADFLRDIYDSYRSLTYSVAEGRLTHQPRWEHAWKKWDEVKQVKMFEAAFGINLEKDQAAILAAEEVLEGYFEQPNSSGGNNKVAIPGTKDDPVLNPQRLGGVRHGGMTFKVLDLGCGRGYLSNRVKQLSSKIVCVELSERAAVDVEEGYLYDEVYKEDVRDVGVGIFGTFDVVYVGVASSLGNLTHVIKQSEAALLGSRFKSSEKTRGLVFFEIETVDLQNDERKSSELSMTGRFKHDVRKLEEEMKEEGLVLLGKKAIGGKDRTLLWAGRKVSY
ncbi:hypothetical protein TrLO_g5180 [Triparma laevis f. longispina]|uniref:Methyltransferase domain-containing protein n=1 Tax=Triparma laevis f. longispina TaxID=1714387 RepID=A0A9W7FG01_9STRA|nr:hypothetical protein TrLO_g5180 [Triparma laevis f. longispina]